MPLIPKYNRFLGVGASARWGIFRWPCGQFPGGTGPGSQMGSECCPGIPMNGSALSPVTARRERRLRAPMRSSMAKRESAWTRAARLAGNPLAQVDSFAPRFQPGGSIPGSSPPTLALLCATWSLDDQRNRAHVFGLALHHLHECNPFPGLERNPLTRYGDHDGIASRCNILE